MKSGVISAPPHTLREYSTSSYIARIQHLLIHCEDTAPHIARIQFLSCFMSYIARIQSSPSRIQNILYYSSKDTDTMYHPLQEFIYSNTILPLKDTEYIVPLIQGYRYNYTILSSHTIIPITTPSYTKYSSIPQLYQLLLHHIPNTLPSYNYTNYYSITQTISQK